MRGIVVATLVAGVTAAGASVVENYRGTYTMTSGAATVRR